MWPLRLTGLSPHDDNLNLVLCGRCAFVRNGEVVATGSNRTNEERNVGPLPLPPRAAGCDLDELSPRPHLAMLGMQDGLS